MNRMLLLIAAVLFLAVAGQASADGLDRAGDNIAQSVRKLRGTVKKKKPARSKATGASGAAAASGNR